MFKRRLVLDEVKVVVHSDDMDAPVGLLQTLKWHTEAKGSSSYKGTSYRAAGTCFWLPTIKAEQFAKWRQP